METASVEEVINQAYAKVNGEYETVTVGSEDFFTYLAALNRAMTAWYETPFIKWQTLYNYNYTLPETVAAGKLLYAVPEIRRISLANSPLDSVYFVNNDGEVVDTYKMTDQAIFDSTNDQKVAALYGDGLHLKSVSEEAAGAKIKLPVYMRPPKYTSVGQVVIIDSIGWLINYMSAELCDASPVPFIARNADKYYKQADISMKGMRDRNRHRQHLINTSQGKTTRRTWEQVMSAMTMKDL